MQDFGTKTDNSPPPGGQLSAAEFNNLATEAENAVLHGGLSLDSGSVTQLATSMFLNSVKAGSFQDNGVANAYVATPVSGASGVLLPGGYTPMDGAVVGFAATATNTAASTLNIGQTTGTLLGTKKILTAAGAPLPAAAIVAGTFIQLRYSAALDAGVGAWTLLPWSTITIKQVQIQPVTAAVAASALTVTLNVTSLDFRSSVLSNGTVNTRPVPAAITLTVPSGATLGTANNVLGRLIVLALDNAGTVELAIVNLSGGNNLDETTLITTTAITAGSTAANVIYSTAARVGVPFRVVGFVDSTQATAGAWVTTPSTVQGQGGNALAAMGSFGYGQTIQDLTGSRSIGTTFTNTTGRSILVNVNCTSTAGSQSIKMTIGGIIFIGASQSGAGLSVAGLFIIPHGETYVLNAGSYTLNKWLEIR